MVSYLVDVFGRKRGVFLVWDNEGVFMEWICSTVMVRNILPPFPFSGHGSCRTFLEMPFVSYSIPGFLSSRKERLGMAGEIVCLMMIPSHLCPC